MKFLGDINPDDHMLINIIYNRKSDSHKHDFLYIIYKNKRTGEKFLKTIEEPTIDYYIVKEEFRDYNYRKDFMSLDKVEKVTCKYKNLAFDIANRLGGSYKDYINSCIANRNFRDIRKIHSMSPYVFASDIPIETWYKIQYMLEYPSSDINFPLTKQFLDIEVDGIHVEGFPTPDLCPINAVTVIDNETLSAHTFLLRNKKNPLIDDFENNISKVKQQAHDMFDEVYGVFDYNIYMYDKEIELIRDVFKLINTFKRDFLEIWNMPFDIGYFIERIHVLGYEHEPIVCHHDFKTQSAYLIKSKKKVVEARTDKFSWNSYTTCLDQMRDYAGLRKGGGVLRSTKLNDVGKAELKEEKIDYSQDANIKTLPYVDYVKFYLYNVKDVLLQYGIDKKTSDLDNLYLRTLYNATPYEKAFSQTIFLKNTAYISYYNQGFIITNSRAIDENKSEKNVIKSIFDMDNNDINNTDDDDDDQYAGALVADPMNNSRTGIILFGTNSKFVYDFVTDEDFTAMYPSERIAFNVSASTLIGKLAIDMGFDQSREFYNQSEKDIMRFDAGRDFIENYICDNIGIFGTKWFDLPTIDELIECVESSR